MVQVPFSVSVVGAVLVVGTGCLALRAVSGTVFGAVFSAVLRVHGVFAGRLVHAAVCVFAVCFMIFCHLIFLLV